MPPDQVRHSAVRLVVPHNYRHFGQQQFDRASASPIVPLSSMDNVVHVYNVACPAGVDKYAWEKAIQVRLQPAGQLSHRDLLNTVGDSQENVCNGLHCSPTASQASSVDLCGVPLQVCTANGTSHPPVLQSGEISLTSDVISDLNLDWQPFTQS